MAQPDANHPIEPGSTSLLANFAGPYSATTNGVCADGHPTNTYGRCEFLNDVQATAVGVAITAIPS
jgi:hypothetical protein